MPTTEFNPSPEWVPLPAVGGHISTSLYLRDGMSVRAWVTDAGRVAVSIGGLGGSHDISLDPQAWATVIATVITALEDLP